MFVSLPPSLFFQVKAGFYKTKKYLLNFCRSPISDMYCVHDQGDVVEVGVGQGGQEADAQTD